MQCAHGHEIQHRMQPRSNAMNTKTKTTKHCTRWNELGRFRFRFERTARWMGYGFIRRKSAHFLDFNQMQFAFQTPQTRELTLTLSFVCDRQWCRLLSTGPFSQLAFGAVRFAIASANGPMILMVAVVYLLRNERREERKLLGKCANCVLADAKKCGRTYQWHVDWRIRDIMPIESRSYSIFPRGILIVVPMRRRLFANMLIVSMFAAMSLRFIVRWWRRRRRWRRGRRLDAWTIFSKSMTILWRRWYDRNDFISFWHRRIFIKTITPRLRSTAIEYGNLHVGRWGGMPTAIPLIPFVRISVDIATRFLCIVWAGRLRSIVAGMMFCVMWIRFAFRGANTFRFAAAHYASLLWGAFGCAAWI